MDEHHECMIVPGACVPLRRFGRVGMQDKGGVSAEGERSTCFVFHWECLHAGHGEYYATSHN